MITAEEILSKEYCKGFSIGAGLSAAQTMIVFRGVLNEMPDGYFEKRENSFVEGMKDGAKYRELDDTGHGSRNAGHNFSQQAVVTVTFPLEDWQKFTILNAYAEQIADHLYPNAASIEKQDLVQTDFQLRNEILNHALFMGALRGAVIEEVIDYESDTVTVYLLRALAHGYALAADAMMNHPVLSNTVYAEFWDQTWEQLGDKMGGDKTEQAEKFADSFVMTAAVLVEFSRTMTRAESEMTLAMYLK